jgi:DNA topoisomerase III
MKVIIAEKPSVAQAIASVVGARQRKEGYLMGDGYAVAWAFGHLVGLAMPESYGLSGFRREHLPILPQEFRLVPRQVREGKAYKDERERDDRVQVATGWHEMSPVSYSV